MQPCPNGLVIPVTLGNKFRFTPPWVVGEGALLGKHWAPAQTSGQKANWRTIHKGNVCPGPLAIVTRSFVEGSMILQVQCPRCLLKYESDSWTGDSFTNALAIWLTAAALGNNSSLVESYFVGINNTAEQPACLATGAQAKFGREDSVLLALCPDDNLLPASIRAQAYLMGQMREVTSDAAHTIAQILGFRHFPANR